MLVGANPDELDDLALVLERAARKLHAMHGDVLRRVQQSPWQGADADQFEQRWRVDARKRFGEAESLLTAAAETAGRNAEDQRRTSDAASGEFGSGTARGSASPGGPETMGHGSESPDKSLVRSDTYRHGVGVEGTTGVTTRLYQTPDGKWRLAVTYQDGTTLDAGELLDVASLGKPGAAALKALANVDGSWVLNSESQTWVFEFDDPETALRVQEAFHDRQNDLMGTKPLNQNDVREILEAQAGEGNVRFIEAGHSSEGVSGKVGLSIGGIDYGVGDAKGIKSVSVDYATNQITDSMTVGGIEFDGGAGTLEAGQSISVVRDADGNPISVTITDSRAYGGEASLSTDQIVKAVGGPDMPLGLTVGAEQQIVMVESRSFDLSDPKYAGLRELLETGSPARDHPIDGDALFAVSQALGGEAGTGYSAELHRVETTTSETNVLFSWEHDNEVGTDEVLWRSGTPSSSPPAGAGAGAGGGGGGGGGGTW